MSDYIERALSNSWKLLNIYQWKDIYNTDLKEEEAIPKKCNIGS